MIQALLQGIKTIYNITDNLKKKKKDKTQSAKTLSKPSGNSSDAPQKMGSRDGN